eukprot:CAMPEP_0202688870 /NCGR_PEP_ID=MMETSP1385-20130828/4266_1 /ASSEMBLY_ACC=CAM_ASM_000861 /TAXON_ID=933848 /ORGANISM="Elphidium margaritaceum" /LENGTH=338 /DNA_ID=CAMNT_0049343923 /DNA_START=47 /DNA_END=1063 /DNA_ORIENTATION=+
MSTCYGQPSNPLYPAYENKDEELAELLQFFQFAYEPSSGYTGRAVFEIIDDDQTRFLEITCDPNTGVTTSRDAPSTTDGSGNSFYCSLPYETFHNAFWGLAHPRTLVMGGGCNIKHWKYRQAYNFAMSFDMTSPKWVAYYNSPHSIKKMVDSTTHTHSTHIMDGIEHIYSVASAHAIDTPNDYDHTHHRLRSRRGLYDSSAMIGHTLPTSANDAEFMYEWKPSLSSSETHVYDCEPDLELRGLRWQALAMMKSVSTSMVRSRLPSSLEFNTMRHHCTRLWHQTTDEFCGHHSEYKRFNINAVLSSSIVNTSVHKLSTFVRENIDKNELLHWNLLSTMF